MPDRLAEDTLVVQLCSFPCAVPAGDFNPLEKVRPAGRTIKKRGRSELRPLRESTTTAYLRMRAN